MEAFEAVGIIVVALVFYAIASFIVAFLATPTGIDDEALFCIVAWVIGGIIFAVVVYFWITGIKPPI